MGKAKKQVVDDDEAIFAQRAVELKGARPYASPSMTRHDSRNPLKAPRTAAVPFRRVTTLPHPH
jgi:hypothetical protein